MMRLPLKMPSVQLLRKILFGIAIFFVFFALIGFFVMPPVLKSVLTKKLSESLHRSVAIQQIKVNPFVLSVDIKGFTVKDRTSSGTFLSFDELYLNLQSVSLLKRGWIFKELRITRPFVNIVRNEDQSYNFSDLIVEQEPKKAGPAKPLRFSINNIQILNGSLDFWDGPKHTKHTVRELTIKIPFLSTLPYYIETFVQPTFQAKLNGEPVSFNGQTKPFKDSRETVFNVDIKDFDLPYYFSYIPFEVNFKLLSGSLNTKMALSYTQYRDRPPTLLAKGTIEFTKIRIVDKKDAPLIYLPSHEIVIESADVMSKQVHLKHAAFQSPEIDLVLEKSGTMNVQSLIPKKGYVVKRKEEASVLVFDADEIILVGGRISFSDLSRRDAFKTVLENVNVKIDHFSNRLNKKSAIGLSLATEAGEGMKITGEFTVDPLGSEGTFELNKILLRKYAPYYSGNVLFDIDKGDLDLKTRYAFFMKEPEPEILLTEAEITLNSLSLRKRDEKEGFLTIPVVSVGDTSVDLSKKELVVGGISTEKGVLKVKRAQDGTVNLATLMPPAHGGEEKEIASREKGKDKDKDKNKDKKDKPWMMMAKKLAVERYSVGFEDLVPSEPVNVLIHEIRLRGTDLSTAKNHKGRMSFACSLNKKGSLSANGAVSIDPLSADLSLDLKGIDIMPAQSYFTDRIKIIVTSGALSAKGKLSLASGGEGLSAVYTGDTALTEFASMDKLNAEDFLKWNSLHLSGISVGYNPLRIKIDEVALTDFYSRFIINKDGSLNVQDIMEEGTRKTEAPGTKEEVKAPDTGEAKGSRGPMKIEKVTLQGGTINFSDRHIEPNFSANLLEIGGRVSGLSSEENTVADVDLRGKLENSAPLEITGKINPLKDDLYIDLKMDFKDMDLSPVSPYAGKYIGYTVQKGKLSLSLQYLIVKKKLDSQNKVFLDQFTLGDKVDSPDATKLPVRLAIALLKNRKGEIDLDLPVTGYIDDPKFSLGKVIIKILLNLLTKAATSPFALLGALFGGSGEELSYLVFDYGSFSISEEGVKKLDALEKALYDRPSLKLEIEGHVDPEKDREGLRQHLFKRKIKAQKLKEMAKKGMTAVPVDEVVVGDEEYPKYLKMAYKEEKFPKPRNIIGIAKDLPVPEMEKLMLTHLEVSDDDLRSLASQRAKAAEDYLLKSKQVGTERIFLVEPKSLQPEKNEKLKDSRVDFRLK
ncbi:MAG TPA: DUF748 domain-containing protein [Thermodesulfovibrionales bacterium]|nr:DUF748 domain-containing protein [Thermodesulfovibrionales bacterium]